MPMWIWIVMVAWFVVGLIKGIIWWDENCTGYNSPDGLSAIFSGLPVVACIIAGPLGFLLWRN